MDRQEELLERLRGALGDTPRVRLDEPLDGAQGGSGGHAGFRGFDAALGRDVLVCTAATGEAPARGAAGSRPALSAEELRLVDEALVTGRLNHPGIAPIHDLALDASGRVYYTTRLFRGEPWSASVAGAARDDGAAALARAIDALRSVCETLAYAHDRGVAHGDVAPERVLVGESGETCVTGWGVAAEATVARDLAAVGGLLRALLAGRATAPQELLAIAAKAEGANAAARYATMAEVVADLRAWSERRVVLAHRTGALAEFRKWVARNRLAAALFAAALVSGIAALAVADVVARRRNAELARTHDAIVARLDDLFRLEALKSARDLATRADTLWPIGPAQLPAMRRWRDEARRLLADRPRHAARQAELERAATRADDGTLRFADGAAAWWHESLTQLAEELAGLADPDPFRPATLAAMERRIAASETLAARSLADARDAWAAAIARVGADPRFRGVALAPQLGLVPLGPDPESKLEEFWQLETGDRPARDATTGRIVVTEAMGLVLVLLPGTTLRFVDSPDSPGVPTCDPRAAAGPGVRDVALDPFFCSKFEVTQGQWLRLTGANPSGHAPASAFCRVPHDLRHPVEMVALATATAVLHHLDLELPTYAQWSHADRAGTTTTYWTGDDPATLNGRANIADRRFQEQGRGATLAVEPWDDGWFCTAPVGSFGANPFGLHDTLGNVEEMLGEPPYEHATVEFAPGDGRRRPVPPVAAAELVLVEGGSYVRTAKCCSSSEMVIYFVAGESADSLGVRPVRRVLPAGAGE